MNWQSRRAFLAGSMILPRNLMSQVTASTPLTAATDTRQVGAPISKYLYGMFLEHAGNLVYRSLWSELLDDVSFILW